MSRRKNKPKKLILGDEPIDSPESDCLGFESPSRELVNELYGIPKSIGVCCGIIGPWGSGKSSFMKLMDEYIRKESRWENVYTIWFSAWDPGALKHLGSAMMLDFFQNFAEQDDSFSGALKKLRLALETRDKARGHARQALLSKSVVISVDQLKALDAPKKIKNLFDEIGSWLEKNRSVIFLFIDDIDRATGEQILDILSALKLFVIRRRIVTVIAYDEDYVLKALQSALPLGIVPERFLEKVVTVKKDMLSLLSRAHLKTYVVRLLRSLNFPEPDRLAPVVVSISSKNPRRIKNIILSLHQILSQAKYANAESLLLDTLVPLLIERTQAQEEAERILSEIKEDISLVEETALNKGFAKEFKKGRKRHTERAIVCRKI